MRRLALLLTLFISGSVWAGDDLYDAQRDWQQAMQFLASDIERSFFIFTHERPQPQVTDAEAIQHFSAYRSEYVLEGEPALSLALIYCTQCDEPETFKGTTLKYFSKILGDVLNQNPKLTLVNRDQLDAILKELQLQSSDLIDANTSALIGRLQGVRYLVFVTVEMDNIDSNFFVKVVNVETGVELAPFDWPGIFSLKRYFTDAKNYSRMFTSFRRDSLELRLDTPPPDTGESPQEDLRFKSLKEFGSWHLRGSRPEGPRSFYERGITSFHGAAGETQATRMTLYEMGPILFRRNHEVTQGADLRFGVFSYNDGYRSVDGFRGRWMLDSTGDVESQRFGVLHFEAPNLHPVFSDRWRLGFNLQVLDYEDDSARDYTTSQWLSAGLSSRWYPSKTANAYVSVSAAATGLQDIELDQLDVSHRNALHAQVATCVATADETWVCEVGARLEAIELPKDSNSLQHVREFVRLKRNLSRTRRPSDFPDVWLTFEYEQDDWDHDQLATPESQQLFSIHLLFEF